MRKLFTLIALFAMVFAFGSHVFYANGNQPVVIETYLEDGTPIVNNVSTNKGRGEKYGFDSSGISANYDFAFYAVNGVVRDDLPENYQFTVRANMKITAIFHPHGRDNAADLRHVVVFADSNGYILDVQYVAAGGNASDLGIVTPDKPNAVVADPKWKTTNDVTSIEGINSNRVYYLQYELQGELDQVELLVLDASGSGMYDLNEVATLVANPTKEGVPFSHFADEDGNVLSTKLTYKFTIVKETIIEAVYSNDPAPTAPLVNMTDTLNLRSGHTSYVGQFELAAGYELVEYGFIISRSSDVLTLDSLGATIVPSNVHNGQTNEFLRSFPTDTYNSVRAYLIVFNTATSETEEFYSQNYNRTPESIGEASSILYNPDANNTGYAPKNVVLSGLEFRMNGTQITNTAGKGVTGNYFVMNSSSSNAVPRYEAHIEFDALFASDISFIIAPWTTTETGRLTKFSFQQLINTEWVDLIDLLPLVPDTVENTYLVEQQVTGGVFRIYTESILTSDSRVIVDEITIQNQPFTGPIHEIKYNVDGVLTSDMIAQGETITLVPTKANYIFAGWYLDSNFETEYVNGPLLQSQVLYAKFTPEIKTITFFYNGADGGEMPATIQAEFGSFVDLPVPTRTGYDFAGWGSETFATMYSDPYQVPSVNRNMYAKWDINDKGRTMLDADELSFPLSITEATTLTLSDEGSNGSSILWGSSNSSIINAATGAVVLPGETTSVTLTATLSLNGQTTVVTFDIEVFAADDEPFVPVVTTVNFVKVTTQYTTTSEDANTSFASQVTDDTNIKLFAIKGGTSNYMVLRTDDLFRMYGNKTDGNGNTLIIEMAEGYVITSITITYTVTNSATFSVKDDSDSSIGAIVSAVAKTGLNTQKIEIKNTHMTTGTVGQLKITGLSITYETVNPS